MKILEKKNELRSKEKHLFYFIRLLNIISFSEKKFNENLNFLLNITNNKIDRSYLSKGLEEDFHILSEEIKEIISKEMKNKEINNKNIESLINHISALDGEIYLHINGERKNVYENLFEFTLEEYKKTNDNTLRKMLENLRKYENKKNEQKKKHEKINTIEKKETMEVNSKTDHFMSGIRNSYNLTGTQ